LKEDAKTKKAHLTNKTKSPRLIKRCLQRLYHAPVVFAEDGIIYAPDPEIFKDLEYKQNLSDDDRCEAHLLVKGITLTHE
jgi:hypothetical protein